MKILNIDTTNVIYFSELISDDMLSDVTLSSAYCLGAVDERSDEKVGILIFDIFFAGNGKNEIRAGLRYLFVSEKYRNMGIGSSLCDEMLRICRESSINKIQLVLNRNQNDDLAPYFINRGFTFKQYTGIDTLFNLADLNNVTKFAKKSSSTSAYTICEISDLSSDSLNEALFNLLKNTGWSKKNPLMGTGAYSPETSFALMKKDKIEGLLLTKVEYLMYDDMVLDVLLFRVNPNITQENIIKFILGALIFIHENYDENTSVHVESELGTGMDLLKLLLPKCSTAPFFCGTCSTDS